MRFIQNSTFIIRNCGLPRYGISSNIHLKMDRIFFVQIKLGSMNEVEWKNDFHSIR
ncbi:MAG: hypothetical protein GW789_06720 [Ignavibacteria bacterium]|nr:hypothetical protein [Ignavibacteria bacterium]